MSLKLKRAIRAAAFFLLLIFVVYQVQHLVIPKYDWPNHNRRSIKGVGSVYNEPRNSLDVVFLGTSQTFCGISPMNMYDASHLRSYNLASIGQRIPVSYYLLESVLKRQSPKLVMVDASGFFYTEKEIKSSGKWQEIIDVLPWRCLADKWDMVNGLAELRQKSDDLEYKLDNLIPMLRYHANYRVERDSFFNLHMNQVYQRKGFVAAFNVKGVPDDQIAMAMAMLDANDPSSNDDKALKTLTDALAVNKPYLERMAELCDRNDVQLVFFKVPVCSDTSARGYWSANKHSMVQELADEMGVPFLDMNYMDIGLDWHKDTHDSGVHLNYNGAKKTSDSVLQWIQQNYDIAPREDAKLDAQWDYQSQVFAKEMAYLELELETDLFAFMDRLKEGDYTLFIAVTGNVGEYWSDDAQRKFEEATGATLDLRDPENAAYLCVSTNGKVLHEQHDASACLVEDKLKDGLLYRVESAVQPKGDASAVQTWYRDYAAHENGLHIVVYDNGLKCVVDSVCFNANDATLEADHKSGYQPIMREYLIQYAYKAMKKM